MLFRLLRNAEGAEGGEGGVAETKPVVVAAKVEDRAPDLAKAVEGLVARHGDPTAALRVLMGENYTLRDQARDLKGKLPAEGSVVLAGDDARHWGDYRKLGAPADLRRAIDAGKQFEAEAGGYRKAELIGRAAEVTAIDGARIRPAVLGRLAEGLDIEVRDELNKEGKPVLKDGKPVRQAVVKGEGDKVTPLADYAKQHWGDFLPALKAEADARRPGTPNTHQVRPIPARGSGQGAGGDQPPRRRTTF